MQRGLLPGGRQKGSRNEVYVSSKLITDGEVSKREKAGKPMTKTESGVKLSIYSTHGERNQIVEIDTK